MVKEEGLQCQWNRTTVDTVVGTILETRLRDPVVPEVREIRSGIGTTQRGGDAVNLLYDVTSYTKDWKSHRWLPDVTASSYVSREVPQPGYSSFFELSLPVT